MTHSLRPARALRIYCPVAAATLHALVAGDLATVERDPVLAAMLAIVRAENPLGDFGLYRAVVSLAPGWELFVPAPDARPTLGAADTPTASPTVILTLYLPADAPQTAVAAAVDAVVAAHPWETPVIEFADVQLVTRG